MKLSVLGLSLIVPSMFVGLVSSATAGGYYYAPYAYQPVYVSPVVPVTPVVSPPIVQTSYYAPVYSYPPAYIAPVPVVVTSPAVVHQSTRVNWNSVTVRSREYSPFAVGPVSNQFYRQRWTPHGVVIRHRGY